jgi:SHS2 domain-containing protein
MVGGQQGGTWGYTEGVTDAGYQEVDHTADWALRVQGKDLAELLVNAARGTMQLSGASPGPGEGTPRRLRLEAADREALLVTWLEELLFAMETHETVWTGMQIHAAQDRSLDATVQESPLAGIARHIKAVTYHNLSLQATPEGLEATVVFDV